MAEKLNKILPKTLEVYCDSHCKRSSIEPHFLSIALFDWTIKQKRQNRNMGYVCVFALSVKCEASHNNVVKVDFLYSKSWYGARRDYKRINNAFILETLSSAKKKKQYVGF